MSDKCAAWVGFRLSLPCRHYIWQLTGEADNLITRFIDLVEGVACSFIFSNIPIAASPKKVLPAR